MNESKGSIDGKRNQRLQNLFIKRKKKSEQLEEDEVKEKELKEKKKKEEQLLNNRHLNNSESNKKDVQDKDNNDVVIKPVTKKAVVKPKFGEEKQVSDKFIIPPKIEKENKDIEIDLDNSKKIDDFKDKIQKQEEVVVKVKPKFGIEDSDKNKEKDNINNDADKKIDDLEKIWIGEAKYSEVVKDEVIETESIVNMIMEACMFKVASISELDGLVTVDNGNSADYSEEEILEIINSEDRVELPYSAKLSYQDRLELLKYFKVFLINNIKEWKKIVDIASELRQYNVEDDAINKSGLISSDELLKSAINEYEEEIKDTMKPIDIPKHTPEEFCKILNELGYKKKNRKYSFTNRVEEYFFYFPRI